MLAGGQAPRLTLPACFTNCPTQAARIGPYLHGGHIRRHGVVSGGAASFEPFPWLPIQTWLPGVFAAADSGPNRRPGVTRFLCV